MCRVVYLLIPSVLLSNDHCSESLVPGIAPRDQALPQLQLVLDGIDARVGSTQGPTVGLIVAKLHACPQGSFTLACGKVWGPSLQRAGASSLA